MPNSICAYILCLVQPRKKNRAGVTVVIVGLDFDESGTRTIFTGDTRRVVPHINPYLTEHNIKIVEASRSPLFLEPVMDYGVYYSKSAGLILDPPDKDALILKGFPSYLIKSFLGSTEFINGKSRYCLWLSDEDVELARGFPSVASRIDSVRRDRLATKDKAVNKLAVRSHQFRERKGDEAAKLFVPIVSSEHREYFPVGLVGATVIPTNKAFYMGDCPLWCLSIIASRLHLAWIATVCGRLEMRYSYSNTLGWNTFPVPTLTEKNKADLTRCAENILMARESHFPATIAELYDPDAMPDDLRAAHERNDEVLERIYIGRRFKNDTERLGKLFDLYSKLDATAGPNKGI